MPFWRRRDWRLLPDNDLPEKNTDSIPFTDKELNEPPKSRITERALIHDPSKYNRIQTRSQARNKNIHQEESSENLHDDIEERENENNSDKRSDTEEDKETVDEDEDLDTTIMEIKIHKLNPLLPTFKRSKTT